jgi:tRNA threonylcarbamoyladenosine biosynthesis protein TsaB
MLLAIDTASEMMSLALYDGQVILAEQTFYSRNRHTVHLTTAIQRLLGIVEHTPHDLAVLAISQGPGTYSGLRVGFGVAKGLAAACHLPLIPIPTLDILAAATPYFEGDLIVTSQAGRKRIHAGWYQWRGIGWQASHAPENTSWQDLLLRLDKPTLINGEIDPKQREHLATSPLIHCLPTSWNLRRAGFLAEMGWIVYASGEYERDPAKVNPIYLKAP